MQLVYFIQNRLEDYSDLRTLIRAAVIKHPLIDIESGMSDIALPFTQLSVTQKLKAAVFSMF